MPKTIYCAGCDNEAVCRTSDNNTPLCYTCRKAFEWGQASPNVSFKELADNA